MTGIRHHRLHRWDLLPVALAGTVGLAVVASGAARAWTSPLLLVLAGPAAGLAVAGWRRRVEVTVTPAGVAMPVLEVTGRLPDGAARGYAGPTGDVPSSCGSAHRFPGRYPTGAREPLTMRAGGAR